MIESLNLFPWWHFVVLFSSQERCVRDYGGYLAVIESEEENLFLQNIARTKGSNG